MRVVSFIALQRNRTASEILMPRNLINAGHAALMLTTVVAEPLGGKYMSILDHISEAYSTQTYGYKSISISLLL